MVIMGGRNNGNRSFKIVPRKWLLIASLVPPGCEVQVWLLHLQWDPDSISLPREVSSISHVMFAVCCSGPLNVS